MLEEHIIFNGKDVTVVDCTILSLCSGGTDSTPKTTKETLMLVATNELWFNSLTLGKTYSATIEDRTCRWLLTDKDADELELTFELSSEG